MCLVSHIEWKFCEIIYAHVTCLLLHVSLELCVCVSANEILHSPTCIVLTHFTRISAKFNMFCFSTELQTPRTSNIYSSRENLSKSIVHNDWPYAVYVTASMSMKHCLLSFPFCHPSCDRIKMKLNVVKQRRRFQSISNRTIK